MPRLEQDLPFRQDAKAEKEGGNSMPYVLIDFEPHDWGRRRGCWD